VPAADVGEKHESESGGQIMIKAPRSVSPKCDLVFCRSIRYDRLHEMNYPVCLIWMFDSMFCMGSGHSGQTDGYSLRRLHGAYMTWKLIFIQELAQRLCNPASGAGTIIDSAHGLEVVQPLLS